MFQSMGKHKLRPVISISEIPTEILFCARKYTMRPHLLDGARSYNTNCDIALILDLGLLLHIRTRD